MIKRFLKQCTKAKAELDRRVNFLFRIIIVVAIMLIFPPSIGFTIVGAYIVFMALAIAGYIVNSEDFETEESQKAAEEKIKDDYC